MIDRILDVALIILFYQFRSLLILALALYQNDEANLLHFHGKCENLSISYNR